MLHQIHPNKIKQVLFLSIIILLSILLGKELFFALGAFLGAITLYVLLKNFYINLVVNKKWKNWLAALFIILIILILVIIPFLMLLTLGIKQVTPLISDPTIITNAFEKIHQYLINKINVDVLDKNFITQINSFLVSFLQKVLGSTATMFTSIALMFFIFYYMLVQCFEIEMWLNKSEFLKRKNMQLIVKEFRNIVYGNAIGIPILAIIQGFIALIGYWIFGVNNVILWGILTAIGSVIPIVGTAIVYVPLAIYILANGNTHQGIEVLLWGLIVVGASDNIIRFMLVKKFADVHPLITILGVIIGINIFGFLGIIYGPLLISIFFLLIKIYKDEFDTEVYPIN